MIPLAIPAPSRPVYVLVFGVAALGCLLSLVRARRVEDRDTRHGLLGLLAASGGWAGSHAALLVAPTRGLQVASYMFGLVLGFATVFAWLYFASAYTGRHYHREPTYRAVGLALFTAVVVLKATNPIHELYFTTEYVGVPFGHLAIQQGVFHWVVTGLAYALAAVGLFMLFELFVDAGFDAKPLGGLAALTGLPVVVDLVAFTTPVLVSVIHAPLGVAAFAVGVLFVFDERFLAVQFTGDVDDPVVLLDTDDRIRDFNAQARDLFPGLAGAVGERLGTVPELASTLESPGEVCAVETGDGVRYYLVSDSAFTIRQAELGRVFLFSDVTAIERHRRELRRHNEQLESLAAGIRHELRNLVQIVDGHVDAAGAALDDDDPASARESLETATDATARMRGIVGDLSTLAQYGQTLDTTTTVDFRQAVEGAWLGVETDGLSLTVEGDGSLEADPGRLDELFRSAFAFAARTDATEVVVERRPDGFAITTDGETPAAWKAHQVFDYDAAVPSAEAGMALPNLGTLARVHGWSVAVESDDDRLVVVVTDVSATGQTSPDRRGGSRQAS